MVRKLHNGAHCKTAGTYNLVGVHNRLQAMGDGDDRDVLRELRAQRALYDSVGFVVCNPSQTALDAETEVFLTNRRRSWRR